MDWWGILKRAWEITWRYKALWVLGFFAGASGGSFGGAGGRSGTGYRTGRADFPDLSSKVAAWVDANLALVVLVGGLLLLAALAYWILSIAAQAGLVYGANEAAEGRRPSLGSCWRVGFQRWGRVFMIGLLVGLPVVALVLVLGAIAAAVVAGGVLAAPAERTATLLVGACLGLPLVLALVVVAGVALGIVYQLALRHGVLNDATFGRAIVQGWNDLFSRRGAVTFWLVMLLPGIAYAGIAAALIAPFAVAAVLLFVRGGVVAPALLLVAGGLLVAVPSAVYGTFASSAWTLFFRSMSGAGLDAGVTGPAPGPVFAGPAAPPQPSSGPGPVAGGNQQAGAGAWAPPTGAPIVDVEPPPPGAADD